MDQVWQFLVAQLHGNQFFSGAALAGTLIGLLHTLRHWVARAGRALFRRFVVSLTVHSEDPLYVPLTRWLQAHKFDTYSLRYRLRSGDDANGNEPRPIGESSPSDERTTLGPDYGAYFFRHGHRWVRVSVAKESDAAGQGSRRAQTREFLTIQYFGTSPRFLQTVVDDVIAAEARERQKRVQVRAIGMNSYTFESCGTMPVLDGPGHVVLAEGMLEDLTNDVREFFERRDWYESRGIPWRRGFLLHGPPGTGKTSVVRHIARTFCLDVYTVGSSGYMNSNLANALRNVQARSIILFEDIDTHEVNNRAALPKDAATGLEGLMSVSLGDLLNAIDGINPPEQVLIFMTSNRPEALDAALLRPGRIDRRIHLDLCTTEQGVRLARKFFPEANDHDLDVLRDAIADREHSPAELQELFIGSADPLQAAGALAARAGRRLELVRA